MRLLGSVADMAANALQRASLHEQALRHAEELLTINTMGRLLAETLDLDQIYEKLDEIVWQLLDDISHGRHCSLRCREKTDHVRLV